MCRIDVSSHWQKEFTEILLHIFLYRKLCIMLDFFSVYEERLYSDFINTLNFF